MAQNEKKKKKKKKTNRPPTSLKGPTNKAATPKPTRNNAVSSKTYRPEVSAGEMR
jgi:hypothetical protein